MTKLLIGALAVAGVVITAALLRKWLKARGITLTGAVTAYKTGGIGAVLSMLGDPPPVVTTTAAKAVTAAAPFAGLFPTIQTGLGNIGTFFTGQTNAWNAPASQQTQGAKMFDSPAMSGIEFTPGIVQPDTIDIISAQLSASGLDDKTVNQWEMNQTLAAY